VLRLRLIINTALVPVMCSVLEFVGEWPHSEQGGKASTSTGSALPSRCRRSESQQSSSAAVAANSRCIWLHSVSLGRSFTPGQAQEYLAQMTERILHPKTSRIRGTATACWHMRSAMASQHSTGSCCLRPNFHCASSSSAWSNSWKKEPQAEGS